MKIDEYYNHYPTVKNIYDYGLSAIPDTTKYLAANTPLPYFISVFASKTFNFELSLKNLRLINITFSFFTLLLVYYLFSYFKTEFSLEKILIIFFYPYFLKPSFTYYMAIYGLFFYLLFLIVLLSEEKQYFWAGLFISFAILSQQFYLSIFFGFCLVLLVQFFYNKLKIIEIIKFTLPTIVLTLPLIYIWKGLTPPSFNFHSIGVDLTKMTSVLVSIGVISLPFILYKLYQEREGFFKNFNNRTIILIFLVISFALSSFFYPELEKRGGYEKITGMTFNSISMIENFSFIASFIFKVIIVFIGIIGLYLGIISYFSNRLKQLNLTIFIENIISLNNHKILLINSFFLIIGFSFNILLAERHLLPLIITILIYYLIDFKDIKILRALLFIYFIVGSIHFYYYLFISKSF